MIRWQCMRCEKPGHACKCIRKRKIKLIYDPIAVVDLQAKFNRTTP